jgi:hypothetical protein
MSCLTIIGGFNASTLSGSSLLHANYYISHNFCRALEQTFSGTLSESAVGDQGTSSTYIVPILSWLVDKSVLSDFYKHIPIIRQLVEQLATGWTTKGSEFESQRGQEFLLLHIIQTGPGVQPACYPMETEGSIPGGKAAGA